MYFFDPKTHHTDDVLDMVFRALQGDHHLDDQLKLLLAVKVGGVCSTRCVVYALVSYAVV
jgi:hypothetical protein